MNLYLISQTANNDWDTYDSAVVAAPDENTAKHMLPGNISSDAAVASVWTSPENVKVKYLGTTELPQSVICESFRAG